MLHTKLLQKPSTSEIFYPITGATKVVRFIAQIEEPALPSRARSGSVTRALPRDMRQVRKADKEEKSPELMAWPCSKPWGSGVMPSPGDSGGWFSIFLC